MYNYSRLATQLVDDDNDDDDNADDDDDDDGNVTMSTVTDISILTTCMSWYIVRYLSQEG